MVGVEEAAYRQAATKDLVRQVMIKLASEKRIAVPVVAVKVTTDKVFRAQLPATRASLGQLYCDRAAPWWPAFEAELLKFPKGANDDQVDALSGALQLAIEQGGEPALAPKPYSVGAAAPRSPLTDAEKRLLAVRKQIDALGKR
jgi:hypothetical protein